MAIKITENGAVRYENEPNVNRTLFPNFKEGGNYDEQIAELNEKFSNLGQAAFKDVADNLTTESEGTNVLDAYQGKILNDKITDINKQHITVSDGVFDGLIQQDHVWIIAVMRISTADSCVLIASNHNGTINVKEIVKDSNFSYTTNNLGTVSIKYNASGQGVYGGAYLLK